MLQQGIYMLVDIQDQIMRIAHEVCRVITNLAVRRLSIPYPRPSSGKLDPAMASNILNALKHPSEA